MKHFASCLLSAARYPSFALDGAREFRSSVGITYVDPIRSESYDAGRELAHILTLRRWDQ